jgi:hypothetical protein
LSVVFSARAFEEAHLLEDAGAKFRFEADWAVAPIGKDGLRRRGREMPSLPDHRPINADADKERPIKPTTSPA